MEYYFKEEEKRIILLLSEFRSVAMKSSINDELREDIYNDLYMSLYPAKDIFDLRRIEIDIKFWTVLLSDIHKKGITYLFADVSFYSLKREYRMAAKKYHPDLI